VGADRLGLGTTVGRDEESMNDYTTLFELAMAQECTVCKAKPGEPCKEPPSTPTKTLQGVHGVRLISAKAHIHE